MKAERGIIDYEPVYGVVIKMTDREAKFFAEFLGTNEFPTYAQHIREALENGTDN